MLIDELEAQGIRLSIHGDKLAFGSEAPITNKQMDFLKENKLNLIKELRDLALVEIDADGDIFPLHRFKAEQMPKPKVTDLAFLNDQLAGEPNRIEVCAEYSIIYKKTFDAEPIEQKKDNAARKVANTWLRTRDE